MSVPVVEVVAAKKTALSLTTNELKFVTVPAGVTSTSEPAGLMDQSLLVAPVPEVNTTVPSDRVSGFCIPLSVVPVATWLIAKVAGLNL